jgi:MltA specific insert domain
MHSSRPVVAASAALAAVLQLTRTGRGFAQVFVRGLLAILVGVILCCAASAVLAEEPLKLADSQLEPAKWADLVGWKADDHLAAFAAYDTSCQALRKKQGADGGQISRALRNVCRKAMGSRPQDSNTARAFFEQNFQPVRIARLGETQGFLTGYYEPVVQGSRFPNPEFHVPVYRRPPDLVAVGYKPGSKAFPNKGTRIGRRNEQNQIVPYYDRGAIGAGALDGQKLEICWLKDPSRGKSSSKTARRCASITTRTTAIHLPRSAVPSPSAVSFRAKKCRWNGYESGWLRILTKQQRYAPPTAPMYSSASPEYRTRANRSARRACR